MKRLFTCLWDWSHTSFRGYMVEAMALLDVLRSTYESRPTSTRIAEQGVITEFALRRRGMYWYIEASLLDVGTGEVHWTENLWRINHLTGVVHEILTGVPVRMGHIDNVIRGIAGVEERRHTCH